MSGLTFLSQPTRCLVTHHQTVAMGAERGGAQQEDWNMAPMSGRALRGERSPGQTDACRASVGSTAGHAAFPRKMHRAKKLFAAAATALVTAGLAVAVQAAPAQATLATPVGPVDTVTNFPSYYQDSTGLRLEPCLNSLNCLPAGPLTAPDGELFYNSASATGNLPARAGVAAGKVTLTTSLEGAYAGSGSGQEVTFGRIRFTATGGLTPGATYTVTHPYGVDKYVADGTGAVTANAGTQDIGGLGPCLGPTAHAAGGACDFAAALSSKIGPFLKWDSSLPATPPGFLGDARQTHKITGSPKGTNVFSIAGPGVSFSTNLFTVSGKVAGPVMATPSKLAFGSQQIPLPGQTLPGTTKSVTITNIGQPSLKISSVALDPNSANAGDFTVGAGTCTPAKVLLRDQTCRVDVTFAPTTTVGTSTATVLVSHDGLNNPERIAISGSAAANGTAPAVDFAPDFLTFAAQRLSTQSKAQTVTITNPGTADLNVSNVALAGADATDFSIQNTCVGAVVAPKGTCKVTVVFAPQLTGGPKTASLQITDDAAGSPRTVALSGTATAGLVSFAPVDPNTGFPVSYTDVSGTTLQMCLVAPNCLTTAATLTAPAGEGFYNNATAKLDLPSKGKAVYVASLEGAFAGSTANQQIVFSRLRFTVSGGLRPNTVYTVTHPFGVDEYKTDGSGAIAKNVGTQDIGGPGPRGPRGTAPNPRGGGGWGGALTRRFGPFLTWDPKVAPAAPAGFVGDGATDHAVTGSPLGTNYVRIEGPAVNSTPTVDKCPTVDGPLADCVETNLFVVAGQLG